MKKLPEIIEPMSNYSIMFRCITEWLYKYMFDSGRTTLVIGISGGVDSALCALLAKWVKDTYTSVSVVKPPIKIIGVFLPLPGNKTEEHLRANLFGKLLLGENFHTLDLTPEYIILKNRISGQLATNSADLMKRNVREGNIKARLRMIYLYHQAHVHNGLVVACGNLTERLLGFTTLHGDTGDIAPIGNLWKTEVYGLANWFSNLKIEKKEIKTIFNEIIKAVPTDGLGISNSDLEQLGNISSYAEVDKLLLDYFLGNESKSLYQPGLIARRANSEFKFMATKLPGVNRSKFHYETYGKELKCLPDRILESM